MILYPTIEFRSGTCVKPFRHAGKDGLFVNDPVEQARAFEKLGMAWIHVVDTEAAVSGAPENRDAVRNVIRAVHVPVQLGGGIRSMETIEEWLEAGVARVIIGTAAVTDPDLVRQACGAFPGRIAVGIDSLQGFASVRGRSSATEIRVIDLALRMEDAGVSTIILTTINHSGALGALDLEEASDLAFALRTPVIVAGNITCLEEIKAIKAEEKTGIAGVICGRALYDGRIDPVRAMKILK
ncbi:MAG: 1-(5-phosphoribosyl)-5-((5-phosphoribosylamino)methylideneamino)imidazole-4-carboxamide isomerase [Alphaproteobacteria bacterium GWF2_58_20]|nr:MAG: 1-(5-phosphoribosyl)-5-((5-phosphoribosylamino)methylideneamino)imidazole-4-carboxamide isomerase [Alphaproteobacteria bacterium GWF2_58_20]